jgi:hypothetical protein
MYRSDVTRSKKECNPNASHLDFGNPHLKKRNGSDARGAKYQGSLCFSKD